MFFNYGAIEQSIFNCLYSTVLRSFQSKCGHQILILFHKSLPPVEVFNKWICSHVHVYYLKFFNNTNNYTILSLIKIQGVVSVLLPSVSQQR